MASIKLERKLNLLALSEAMLWVSFFFFFLSFGIFLATTEASPCPIQGEFDVYYCSSFFFVLYRFGKIHAHNLKFQITIAYFLWVYRLSYLAYWFLCNYESTNWRKSDDNLHRVLCMNFPPMKSIRK